MKFSMRLFLFALVLSACGPVTPLSTDLLSTPSPQEYQDFAYQIVWSPDDSMLALTTSTGVYVYDPNTYKQLAAFDGPAGATTVFSDQYLAAVTNENLFVWDLNDFSLLIKEDAGYKTYFQNVAISPDNRTLVTAEQKQIRIWGLPDGELIAKVPSANLISDMVFSGSNQLVLADIYLGVIQEWDVQNQKKIRTFSVSKPVVNFNLSRDGKQVVVDYGDYGFETWDVDTGSLQHEYPDVVGAPGWNNLSGDSKKVVVWGYGIGEESGLSVWDLAQHKKISELAIPIINGDGWRCGALNSDGTVLAASNNEGYIYFYDLKSNQKLGEIYLPYKFTV